MSDPRATAQDVLEILVDRGWIELSSEDRLPALAVDLGELFAIPVEPGEQVGWLEAWLLGQDDVVELYADRAMLTEALTTARRWELA